MAVLIAYDIADDHRRATLAELLEASGIRVQESVFECALDGSALRELVERALQVVRPTHDSLRIYRLCRSCDAKVEAYGISLCRDTGSVQLV